MKCEIRAEGCFDVHVHYCTFYDEVTDECKPVWICVDCCLPDETSSGPA